MCDARQSQARKNKTQQMKAHNISLSSLRRSADALQFEAFVGCRFRMAGFPRFCPMAVIYIGYASRHPVNTVL
jgi:hypothetical protein